MRLIYFSTLAFALVGCDESPPLPDNPSKEQAVAYVREHLGGVGDAGEGRVMLWYVPYKPELQAHGSTSQPARSHVLYREDGICLLKHLGHDYPPHLAPCDMEPPKGAFRVSP